MRRLIDRLPWRGRGNAAEATLLLAAATLVVPVVLFAGASWLAWGDVRQAAEERLQRSLDLLYANARSEFETYRLVAANVALLVGDRDAEAIRADEPRLHQSLGRLLRSLPQVDDIRVIDRDGVPLVAAQVSPLPPAVSHADRSYFVALRDGAERRFVSERLRDRLRDIDYFQYAERRPPEGPFDGVITVGVTPQYFSRQFEQASELPLSAALLVRADGAVLVRYPKVEGEAVRLAPDGGLMRAIAAAPNAGSYTIERSAIDGVGRMAAYRKLPDLPVYVVLSYATAAIREAWIDRMASHLVFGVPATLALFLLALVAARRAREQAETLERLHAEQARRAIAEDSLRQSQKLTAIGELAAGIAHDFNNLLTAIGGAVEMMGRRVPQPPPDFTRFLELARTAVARAATLTQRLLAFSRQQPLQIDTVDANRLVAGMSELLRGTLGERIEVETVLAGGLWRARADAAQLESTVLNLAINGRDAMPKGGTLTIETANAHLDDAYAAANSEVSAGQYVLVAVSDTGIGMDPETIARAFEPFFTTKQRGQGTGLGLSMAFGYAKQIGGHLKIYSEVGHGTTVKLYIPRGGDDAPAEPEPARAAAAVAAGRGPTVLVVEDDAAVRDFAVTACRDLGCTVHQAGDAAEALAVLRAEPAIELLFTDIGLPGDMNGRALAAAATALRPGLAVLYTTGYTANAIVHHGVLDPGVQFIGKPFSLAALAAKLKAMGYGG